ncbi:helix-turn-helix domain-containing protein [Bosea sp. R86505]|uniref:helix-turn-helix domain-containing protein n=1 Tax=Bosea sp. R86505 TaxID=3101710 RepID=UPI00366E5810
MRAFLVEARKSQRLSQAEVARRLQRPQSYIADIERRERRIDVIEFLALADALDFDPAAVLSIVRAIRDDDLAT